MFGGRGTELLMTSPLRGVLSSILSSLDWKICILMIMSIDIPLLSRYPNPKPPSVLLPAILFDTGLVFLPGEFHGRRSLVGYSPRGCKESDTTERLHSLCTVTAYNEALWWSPAVGPHLSLKGATHLPRINDIFYTVPGVGCPFHILCKGVPKALSSQLPPKKALSLLWRPWKFFTYSFNSCGSQGLVSGS